jgi:hypothetical protein
VTWMQTFSGKVFYPMCPDPSLIDLHDVAHSLSMQCRFAGHVRWHFSVAQHSVLVSKHVPPEMARWGLLHDVTEAYLVDLPQPVKGCLPEYAAAEARLERAVAERFGLELPMPERVKRADLEALATEYRDLTGPGKREWESLRGVTPWPERTGRWTIAHAKATFLAVAKDLKIQ